MAIIVEQEKKNINWFAIAAVALIAGVLLGTVYFLFLTPVPFIEKVIPAGGLSTIKTISTIDFQTSDIINHPSYKVFREYEVQVDLTVPASRSNPFLPLR